MNHIYSLFESYFHHFSEEKKNESNDRFVFILSNFLLRYVMIRKESFTRLFLTNSQCRSYFLTKQSQMIELLNEYFVL